MAVVAISGLLIAGASPALAQPTHHRHHATYANAKFVERRNHHTFGQAPVFMPDGRVVVGEDSKAGGTQIYISRRSGKHRKCLTCELKAPNNVPAVRPQGNWILFHSWMGHSITLGSPGYGGIGSELYVMRPDGSHVTKLYGLKQKSDYGEGTDDYHAYWSPNGKRLVWAHFNGNFIDGGGKARWDIRVANFVVRHGKPRLTHVRVVRPANKHWYETQWWAPNGKGFLYTESFGSAVNTDLFYCRLPKHGMCRTTRLTRSPAWDEQAIFTPNGKNVVFMSSRAHPGFYNTFSTVMKDLEVSNDLDNFLILPVFELAFLQPVAQERTDLYELHLKTGSLRRLTHDGNHGWIIPEFTWNPSNRQLFWTESRYPKGVGVPFPVSLTRQLKDTIRYIKHPTIKNIQAIHGNALSAIPLQRRTKYAVFKGLPHRH